VQVALKLGEKLYMKREEKEKKKRKKEK